MKFLLKIDRALAAGSQTPISLEELAATLSLHEVMIARERRVRDAAFITGQWTTEATLGAAAGGLSAPDAARGRGPGRTRSPPARAGPDASGPCIRSS